MEQPTQIQEMVDPNNLPENTLSIPLKADDPDGDRIVIPNFDLTKVNVTRVVLKMGHKCVVQQAGTRQQRRKTRKPIQLKYWKEVESIDALKKLEGMKAGDVVYVMDGLKKNYYFMPDPVVPYLSAWYHLQLLPSVFDGKIKSCEVRIFQHDYVQAAYK